MERQTELFPCAAKLNDGTQSKPTLFPSANNVSGGATELNKTNPQKGFDWLENKSFTTDTAKKLVEFQEELKVLQSKERVTNVKDEKLKHLPATTEKLSRQYDEEHLHQKQLKEVQEHSSRVSESGDAYKRDRKRKKKHRYHSSSDSDSTDRGSHHKKKKSKHHKHKKSHKKEKERDYHKSETIPQVLDSKKIFLEDKDDITYRLDRAGDTNSWRYGSLYKLHIPNYKSYLYGLLGSKDRYIDLQVKQKKKKAFSNRYFGKDNRTLVKRSAEEWLVSDVQSKGTAEEHKEPLYMAVVSKEAETSKEVNDVRQKILDKSTQLYVQGKGVVDTGMEEEERPQDPKLSKVAEYNRKLRQTPQSVQLWLEFVKFQDTLNEDYITPVDTQGVNIDVQSNSRNTLEKKLSIIDKSLESNPGNIDLQLAKLDLCRDTWDGSKISKELEQLLFVHPANMKLWRQFLIFNQSRLTVFSVSKVSKLYHKCFRTVMSVLEGRLQTHTIPADLHEEITGVFIQYCYFLKLAGHREKSVTTLQAMIEYNIFCPPHLESMSNEIKMAAFEKFWGNCYRKIGTKSGNGWKNWEKKSGETEEKASATDEEDLEDLEQAVIDKAGQKWEMWLEIETLRENHHWFPWQPDVSKDETEEDCEDIERIVLFDDISPAVFNVPKHLHSDIVLVILDLIGLKPASMLKTSLAIENTCDIRHTVESCICNKPHSLPTDVLDFGVNLLSRVLSSSQGKQKLYLTQALIEIQLQRFYQQKSLSKSDKKEMRKIVKNVLKETENRNNLFIWVTYIDLERVIGKVGEAQTVGETAMTLYSGVSIQEAGTDVSGLITLCGQYCEILLGIQSKAPDAIWERQSQVTSNIKKVIHVLHCLIEGKKFCSGMPEDLPSTVILKDSARYSKLIDSLCEQLPVDGCEGSECDTVQNKLHSLCWCYCLFVYCTKDLHACLSVCEKLLSVIQDKKLVKAGNLEQEIFTFQLRLVLHHMSTASVSLCALRACLDKALSRFPDNSVFISLFIDVERKSRISGRFNRYFDAKSRSSATPMTVVLAVWAQIKFLKETTSQGNTGSVNEEAGVSSSALVNRTRVWLERCLSRSDLQHCPLLWRLYLQLEKEVGNMKRFKGLFYRAIQQCPWVKTLYMDGVSALGSDQLQELVDLMVEKELRVQIPVEELDILISP